MGEFKFKQHVTNIIYKSRGVGGMEDQENDLKCKHKVKFMN